MTNGRRGRDRASHKKISEQEKRLAQQAKAQQEPTASTKNTDTRPGSPKTARNPAPERPTKSAHRSLAQKRAKHALEQIKTLEKERKYGNYVAFVKALPATIIMSGLGQALAMEKAGAAKDGDVKLGHMALYKHMDEWLIKGWENSVYEGRGDVLGAICNGCEADYIRAQTEAMDYLEWLKKFAVAFLDDKNQEKNKAPDGELE